MYGVPRSHEDESKCPYFTALADSQTYHTVHMEDFCRFLESPLWVQTPPDCWWIIHHSLQHRCSVMTVSTSQWIWPKSTRDQSASPAGGHLDSGLLYKSHQLDVKNRVNSQNFFIMKLNCCVTRPEISFMFMPTWKQSTVLISLFIFNETF